MSDLKLDEVTDDIVVVNNDLVFTEGVDSRRQHLEIRLRTFLTEWFLDTTVGVPFIQQLFEKKNPDNLLINAVLRPEIEKTPGITAINSISFDVNRATRLLQVTIEVQSVDGEFAIEFTQGV